MWGILFGGLMSILGGGLAIWYQAKKAREIRLKEALAEKQIEVCGPAYDNIKQIQTILGRNSTFKQALEFMLALDKWFFSNRLFLPGKFPAKWISIRNAMIRSLRRQADGRSTPEEITKVEEQIDGWTAQAIKELYNDLGLEEIELELIEISAKTDIKDKPQES